MTKLKRFLWRNANQQHRIFRRFQSYLQLRKSVLAIRFEVDGDGARVAYQKNKRHTSHYDERLLDGRVIGRACAAKQHKRYKSHQTCVTKVPSYCLYVSHKAGVTQIRRRDFCSNDDVQGASMTMLKPSRRLQSEQQSPPFEGTMMPVRQFPRTQTRNRASIGTSGTRPARESARSCARRLEQVAAKKPPSRFRRRGSLSAVSISR